MPISSRAALVALPLLAAACHQPASQPQANPTTAAVPGQAADAGLLPCAHGNAPLARDCTVEQAARKDGAVLTLRHPDGAFRRLSVTRDGRGVVAADGAVPATVKVIDADTIEVALGGDRYRLPATVAPRR